MKKTAIRAMIVVAVFAAPCASFAAGMNICAPPPPPLWKTGNALSICAPPPPPLWKTGN